MKLTLKYRPVLAALLTSCLALAGCARAGPETPAPPPITVMVSAPVQRQVTDYSEYTGRIAAVDSVEVRARVSGYLEEIHFKEGKLVTKDEVLFQIDPRPFQALVDFAVAQLAASDAQVKKAKADNARNKMTARTPGAISPQELDQSQAAEEQAVAEVEKAKATLETHRLNLGYTKVRSPINGRISRFNLTPGNLVVQDQTLLTSIVSVDPMYANFDVDEYTVLQVREKIRQGTLKSARDIDWPVFLALANEAGFPHEGTINFVDNRINPRTGTLRLRGVFGNADEALSPGLFARIHLPIGFPHEALLITDRAIDTDQGQRIVYILDKSNRVTVRPIHTGALHDGLRVVEEGLQPGERVIISGLQQIRPGLVVEPKLVDMPRSGAERQQSVSKAP